MQLDIHHLQVIRAIADAGSLSKAAVSLGITQPAVSSQLMRLENMLGYQLFDRRDNTVVPTPMGELLLRRVGAVLPLMNRLVEDVRISVGPGSVHATLRMGVVAGPMVCPVSDVLKELWPGRATAISNDEDVVKLVNLLMEQKTDVALVKDYPNYDINRPDELEFTLIAEEPTVILMPTDHPLAATPPDQPVRLADLAETEWVMGRRTSAQWHEYVAETCHGHGFVPLFRHTVENWGIQLALVRAGGVSPCQASAAADHGPGITYRWLPDGVLTRRHWIGWHRDSFITEHREKIISATLRAYADFRAGWPNRPAAPEGDQHLD